MVTVRVFGTEQKGKNIDEDLAIAHAQYHMPVEIRIKKGNDTHVIHLSMADAVQLQEGIAAIRCGNRV